MPNARLLPGRAARHAVAAVVVDVRRAQRDAGELAQQVRLLVGQRAAAEYADVSRTVGRSQLEQALGDEVEGVRPTRPDASSPVRLRAAAAPSTRFG